MEQFDRILSIRKTQEQYKEQYSPLTELLFTIKEINLVNQMPTLNYLCDSLMNWLKTT